MAQILPQRSSASAPRVSGNRFQPGRNRHDVLAFSLMLAPALILILGFSIYPILNVFYLAVNDMSFAIDPPKWFGLNNFIWALKNPFFRSSVLITLRFTALSILGQTGIGLLLAVLLNQDKLPGRDVFRTIVLYGWVIPEVIAAVIFRFVFASNYGLINFLLGLAHLSQPAWLNDEGLTLYTLIVVNIWRGIPFNTLIYLTALQSVSRDWYESADLDGASSWQKFRYLTLAALSPTMVTTVLLGIIWTSNVFFLPFVMTAGGPLNSTTLWSLLIYQSFFSSPNQISRAAAMSVYVFAILIAIGALYFNLVRRINVDLE